MKLIQFNETCTAPVFILASRFGGPQMGVHGLKFGGPHTKIDFTVVKFGDPRAASPKFGGPWDPQGPPFGRGGGETL